MSHDEPVIIDIGFNRIDAADGGSESPATPTPSRLCRQGYRLSMFALQLVNSPVCILRLRTLPLEHVRVATYRLNTVNL